VSALLKRAIILPDGWEAVKYFRDAMASEN
jgi:hypothetical protein